MVKIIRYFESTCFDKALANPKWENDTNEEMVALDSNATQKLVPLPKDKNSIEI